MGKSSWSRSCASVSTPPCCNCRHLNGCRMKRNSVRKPGFYDPPDPGSLRLCFSSPSAVVVFILGMTRNVRRGAQRLAESVPAGRIPHTSGGGHEPETRTFLATKEDAMPHTLVPSDHVEGAPVDGWDGAKIGTIERLMLDKRSGVAAYAVVKTRGRFGADPHHFPLSWVALKI